MESGEFLDSRGWDSVFHWCSAQCLGCWTRVHVTGDTEAVEFPAENTLVFCCLA